MQSADQERTFQRGETSEKQDQLLYEICYGGKKESPTQKGNGAITQVRANFI